MMGHKSTTEELDCGRGELDSGHDKGSWTPANMAGKSCSASHGGSRATGHRRKRSHHRPWEEEEEITAMGELDPGHDEGSSTPANIAEGSSDSANMAGGSCSAGHGRSRTTVHRGEEEEVARDVHGEEEEEIAPPAMGELDPGQHSERIYVPPATTTRDLAAPATAIGEPICPKR